MAKLDFPAFEKHLAAFDFVRLFIDVLGWNRASAQASWSDDAAGETTFARRTVAELGGVVAIQVVMDAGWPDEQQRMRVWKHIANSHAENLLIFTDQRSGADRLIEESDMAKLYRRHGSDGVNAPQSEPAYRTAYKDALAFVEEQEAALRKA